MKRILFVCIGNICRSPLAEGIARKIAKESNLDINVDSAGTSGWHERELPCDSSIKIAALNDVDISKLRARQVRKSDYMDFDHVVAMENSNIKALKALGFTNVYLLGDFGGCEGIDVPDPLFLNAFDADIREIYSVYTMIESCVKDFIAQKC